MAASEKAASHPARPPRSVRSLPANKIACSPQANKTTVDSSTPLVVAPGLVTLAEVSAPSTIATTPSVTTAATTPSETTTTAASEPTAPSEYTSSHSDAHQLILLRNSMKVDSTFRLQLRIDFVKGGKDRISATNFKIFYSQFETLDFSDCMSSFSKVIFPAVLEYMSSVYGTSAKKSVLWNNSHGKTLIYFREEKLDASVRKRGQARRGTKKLSPFNLYREKVDLHWQDLLTEIGANLYHFSPCTPAEAARTAHGGAIINLGQNIVVFDMMVAMSILKNKKSRSSKSRSSRTTLTPTPVPRDDGEDIVSIGDGDDNYSTPTKRLRKSSSRDDGDCYEEDTVPIPKKLRVEILQPVKSKNGIFKSENFTKVGSVTFKIGFLFLVDDDPFPDFVNLGFFRKRLLIDVCQSIKSFVKNETLSKECSLFYFAGSCELWMYVWNFVCEMSIIPIQFDLF